MMDQIDKFNKQEEEKLCIMIKKKDVIHFKKEMDMNGQVIGKKSKLMLINITM